MEYLVVGTSVLGRSHIRSKTPCQDAYFHRKLPNNWGIAVVSDGAGSYTYSQIGSAFVSQRVTELLHEDLFKESWFIRNTLPTEEEWNYHAFECFKKVRSELVSLAEHQSFPLSELSCTVIALIYSPLGLCIAHIGDGRAAYTLDGQSWQGMMIPYEGEMAGSTVFISQSVWMDFPETLFESRVIQGEIKGFGLMTDGCENASFLCREWLEEKGKFEERNEPEDRFFNAVSSTLKQLQLEKNTADQIKSRWTSFIEKGNEALRKESDDKTFLLGVYVDG